MLEHMTHYMHYFHKMPGRRIMITICAYCISKMFHTIFNTNVFIFMLKGCMYLLESFRIIFMCPIDKMFSQRSFFSIRCCLLFRIIVFMYSRKFFHGPCFFSGKPCWTLSAFQEISETLEDHAVTPTARTSSIFGTI